MIKTDLIIKTYQLTDKFLLVFWSIFFIGSSFTFLDKEILKISWFLIPISLAGLFFCLLKCTTKIIFDFNSKIVIIKNLFFKKIITKDEILRFQRVHSISFGDWYGIVLKKDKYGNPIKISFPPKLTNNIQNHVNIFEKETLPKLIEFLK